ncbi:MAG: PLP-dependent transferase, partial [Myxococcota bacterium]
TRGARTLALRLRQAEANAARLVEHLEAHPAVTRVRYPGLPSHATHDVARRVLKGFGTMLSFELRGGAHQAEEVCRRLQLIHHATSLGGVESTIERRAAIAGQEHLPPTLLRLSVGIENAEDLWADLEAAFASVFS